MNSSDGPKDSKSRKRANDGPKDRKTRKRPNKFENVKSTFFLQKMFDNMLKNKYLSIIKYCKNIQKRMDLNINDYKEYSEKYTSIELEIIPIKNIIQKFINVKKGDLNNLQVVKDTIKEDEKYFHIYFNDSKEEIKRQYLIKDDLDKVKKIKIIIDYQVLSFEKLFQGCTSIESICFKKLYRKNIKNMNYMFNECLNLKEIKFSHFNTDNVTNMSYMFDKCIKLKELNLSHFKTNKLINMKKMFGECANLNELNLINFDVTNLKNISYFISECNSLKKLIVPNNLNFENLENKEKVFNDCIIY